MITNNCRSEKDIIRQERTRQAHWGFNLVLAFNGVSAVIILAGFIFLLIGHTSKGTYLTVGGLGTTAISRRTMQLYRDTNDRLDKIAAKESENKLDKLDSEVDSLEEVVCLENSETQDSQINLSQDTDSGTLVDSLEKLEQAILSDVKNC
jgi:hypothetical protein